MIKAIFFDVDNTLYDQRLYFSSGFKVIAQYLRERYSLVEESVIARFWALLGAKGSMYPRLFDDLLSCFRIYDDKLVKALLQLFHKAPVDSLVPYEDAGDVLPRLTRKYLLGLITNGHADMQRRKVAALGLQDMFSIQVFTAETGYPKPSSHGYEYALKVANIGPQESLYMGDNPHVDFIGAKYVGMHTVRLLRGDFMGVKANDGLVDAQVRNFYSLEKLLANIDFSGTR